MRGGEVLVFAVKTMPLWQMFGFCWMGLEGHITVRQAFEAARTWSRAWSNLISLDTVKYLVSQRRSVGDEVCARLVAWSCVTSRICASRLVAVIQNPCGFLFPETYLSLARDKDRLTWLLQSCPLNPFSWVPEISEYIP